MRSGLRFVLWNLAVVFVAAAPCDAQDGHTPYHDRLEALSPDDPVAYFELAEEIADSADSPETRRLAVRLFVLSFELARQSGTDTWLLPSACIAIAAIEPNQARAAWLGALADATDQRYNRSDWVGQRADRNNALPRFHLAEFIGLTRAGLGAMARGRLDYPGVSEAAEEADEIMNAGGLPPLPISRLRAEASIWPCPECANARVIPDPDDRREGVIFCPTCRGNPGPVLTDAEFAGAIALEAALLNAAATTWSADIALGSDGALLDPDPIELVVTYGIDAARSVFVGGEWVRPSSPEPQPGRPSSRLE